MASIETDFTSHDIFEKNSAQIILVECRMSSMSKQIGDKMEFKVGVRELDESIGH